MPSDQLNDQELQFKKRARRRLVGAIALVLLMVTVLPMLLDDRAAKAPQQEISITIPSQDGAEFTSKVVPVPPQAPLQETPAVSPSPIPAQPEVVTVPVKPEPPKLNSPVKAETPSDPKPVTNQSVTVESSEANKSVQNKTLESKPLTKAEPAQPIKIEPKQQLATVPVEAKPVKDVKPASANTFSVQIGVFSDAENVKKLQQQISDKGYKSYTEKLQTPKGEKIRLRAGPFKTREDATIAATKIKESGLAGMVVSNK